MYARTGLVKMLAFLVCIGLYAAAAFAEESAPANKPHMMYFFNPSCRLCATSNEVVAAAEEKYKGAMTSQHINIADPAAGAENVLYMFNLMDELELPSEVNATLVVVLGVLSEEDGEVYFTPKRALIDGDDIIAKLDQEIAAFLAEQEKGEEKLGMVRPAPFFFGQRVCVHSAS